MDGFTYHDIFATKGIEYLIVIFFFIVLVPFWKFLHRPANIALKYIGETVSDIGRWFLLAEDRYFHQGHSWAKDGPDEVVTVGMDDFSQKLIGRPDSISLPKVGDTLTQGEVGWSIVCAGKKIDMLSPVSGKVVFLNEALSQNAGKINEDPYGQGWLMKIEPHSFKRDMKNLLAGKLAMSWMDGVTARVYRETAGRLGTVLPDGGEVLSGFARHISAENWDELAREYLLTHDEFYTQRRIGG